MSICSASNYIRKLCIHHNSLAHRIRPHDKLGLNNKQILNANKQKKKLHEIFKYHNSFVKFQFIFGAIQMPIHVSDLDRKNVHTKNQ